MCFRHWTAEYQRYDFEWRSWFHREYVSLQWRRQCAQFKKQDGQKSFAKLSISIAGIPATCHYVEICMLLWVAPCHDYALRCARCLSQCIVKPARRYRIISQVAFLAIACCNSFVALSRDSYQPSDAYTYSGQNKSGVFLFHRGLSFLLFLVLRTSPWCMIYLLSRKNIESRMSQSVCGMSRNFFASDANARQREFGISRNEGRCLHHSVSARNLFQACLLNNSLCGSSFRPNMDTISGSTRFMSFGICSFSFGAALSWRRVAPTWH